MYEGEEASAICYPYVEGSSPRAGQHGEIDGLLSSWVWNDATVRLPELPVWPRLELLLQNHPTLKSVFQTLLACPIKPVLYHGDFAPWNIRVSSSAADSPWTVLDWERGAGRGIPGWDWLNYTVQNNTWVRRMAPDETLAEIENLWQSPGFQAYATKTNIGSILKELTFVYLLYFVRYCNPHVKDNRLRILVHKFNKKYFPDVVLTEPPLKISIITPSYKQLPWLKLCAASVADQKGLAVEHIIQDAQSGPELENWIRQNTSARLYVESDAGMYDAVNRGFARATGDIVGMLNSDEQYLEGTLAKVARYFETHPEIDVLFGDALLVSNTGELLSYRRTVQPNVQHIQAVHLNTLACATFVRRSVLDEGFRFDTRWKGIADAVWVVNMLKARIPMAVLNEPLAVFPVDDKSLGQKSLAYAEFRFWRKQSYVGNLRLRPLFVAWHRLVKFRNGAYWPRSMSTRLYTLASPKERVTVHADNVGSRWPHAGAWPRPN